MLRRFLVFLLPALAFVPVAHAVDLSKVIEDSYAQHTQILANLLPKAESFTLSGPLDLRIGTGIRMQSYTGTISAQVNTSATQDSKFALSYAFKASQGSQQWSDTLYLWYENGVTLYTFNNSPLVDDKTPFWAQLYSIEWNRRVSEGQTNILTAETLVQNLQDALIASNQGNNGLDIGALQATIQRYMAYETPNLGILSSISDAVIALPRTLFMDIRLSGDQWKMTRLTGDHDGTTWDISFSNPAIAANNKQNFAMSITTPKAKVNFAGLFEANTLAGTLDIMRTGGDELHASATLAKNVQPVTVTNPFPDRDPNFLIETIMCGRILQDVCYNWSVDYARAAYIAGIIEGKTVKGKTVFDPEAPITRAEFLALLFRAEHLPSGTGSLLPSDVPATHWAAAYIGTAGKDGIVNGYPDGTFHPEGTINRAEAVKMLATADMAARHTSSGQDTVHFSDVPTTHWVMPFLSYAVNLGVIDAKGVNDSGTFQPARALTREEAIKMIITARLHAATTAQ